jgi:TolB-like protein/DNA-binding winged helix-turn-helix (wHTH) protein/Tfp pilus assembly protein PilF
MGEERAPASEQLSVAYLFGPFRLETGSGRLLQGDQPIPLSPKIFQALVYLVERRGQLVTKDDLMQALWTDAIVGESNLTQTIFVLRKALADDGSGQRYITTVPGRGYRFEAEVRRVPENGRLAEDVPAVGTGAEVPAAPKRSAFRTWRVVVGLVIVLIVAAGANFQRLRSWMQPQPQERLMIAVLPFENLTGDAGEDYFSDGMTEEMITQLGRLDPQHLGVIARTSVMHYKHSPGPLPQIAHELGVQFVLEGSVRRDSERVRITAQLIQAKDQTHLWAQEYDRGLKDLLALQGEIAREISHEIQTAIGNRELVASAGQNLVPQSYEAYDLYLKGQYFLNRRTVEGFQRAIDYFQQATAKDPNYARAYAGLADCYALLGGYSLAPQTELMPKARAAALRAVEIDESLAEAHTALALVVQNYDWDWQKAGKEYRRAIELNPNYATAHHWYAEHLALQGRFGEALKESERARQLDPLSLIIATDKGTILYFSRQYDQAIEQFRAVLEMDPDFPRAHMIVFAYAQNGRFADASANIEKGPWRWATLAYVYGRSGQQAEAKKALEELDKLTRSQPVDASGMLLAHLGMGSKEQAFADLERAYAQHSNVLITLKADPIFDPLRDDPRFLNVLGRVGLAE